MAWHVVIAGGGFGGFYAARTLERVLPRQSARVTLVSDVNFMLYTPLLPGAAAGTLEPRHVVVPLREELHATDLRLGTVVGATPERSAMQVQSLEESVGTKLFIRTTKRIELTEAGRALLPYAKKSIDLMRDTEGAELFVQSIAAAEPGIGRIDAVKMCGGNLLG